MRASYLFTSESVSEGHPDKVSDQISDAILDDFIEKDVKLGIADDSLINTRLGCETLCTTNKIVIAGEGRGQLFRTINGVRYAIPGDYAQVDADGTIHLLGRGSVCINSGGEKIFPEEVEEALKTHVSVHDAVVVGIPHETYGEQIVAVVELE